LRTAKIFFLTVGLAAMCGCSSEESGPYFKIAGGGFIFNYRIGEATAGVVVTPERALPADGSFEAIFVNPAGAAPFVMREKVSPTKKRYDFTTPPLSGVKANTDYLMTVRLLDADGNEIGMAEKALRSDLDQTVLPDRPLTVGPGYARNPAAD
jgi:hypothetical protein